MDLAILEKEFEILEKLDFRGDLAIIVRREKSHDLLRFLRDQPEYDFNLLIDLCGVDYMGSAPRFEVVYHLYSVAKNHRLRVRAKVPEEETVVDSVTDLWKAADWFEREVFDLFGIRFFNHPNLKRILLAEEFEGHPLRKDYKMEKRQKIPVPVEKP